MPHAQGELVTTPNEEHVASVNGWFWDRVYQWLYRDSRY